MEFGQSALETSPPSLSFHSPTATTRVMFYVYGKKSAVQQHICFWGRPIQDIPNTQNSWKEVTVAVVSSGGGVWVFWGPQRLCSIMTTSSYFWFCFLQHKRCLSVINICLFWTLETTDAVIFLVRTALVMNILLLGLRSCVQYPRTCESRVLSSVWLRVNPI